MLVAIVLNTTDHLTHIVRTQMGIQTSLACDTLQQLFLIILTAETKTDKVGGRQ